MLAKLGWIISKIIINTCIHNKIKSNQTSATSCWQSQHCLYTKVDAKSYKLLLVCGLQQNLSACSVLTYMYIPAHHLYYPGTGKNTVMKK